MAEASSKKPHHIVARNLHALRLRAGVTQEVLAERADVDLRPLQRVEAGRWNMTVDYLARFQAALGCRWRDLIEGLDAPLAGTKNAKEIKPTAKQKASEDKASRPSLQPGRAGKRSPNRPQHCSKPGATPPR